MDALTSKIDNLTTLLSDFKVDVNTKLDRVSQGQVSQQQKVERVEQRMDRIEQQMDSNAQHTAEAFLFLAQELDFHTQLLAPFSVRLQGLPRLLRESEHGALLRSVDGTIDRFLKYATNDCTDQQFDITDVVQVIVRHGAAVVIFKSVELTSCFTRHAQRHNSTFRFNGTTVRVTPYKTIRAKENAAYTWGTNNRQNNADAAAICHRLDAAHASRSDRHQSGSQQLTNIKQYITGELYTRNSSNSRSQPEHYIISSPAGRDGPVAAGPGRDQWIAVDDEDDEDTFPLSLRQPGMQEAGVGAGASVAAGVGAVGSPKDRKRTALLGKLAERTGEAPRKKNANERDIMDVDGQQHGTVARSGTHGAGAGRGRGRRGRGGFAWANRGSGSAAASAADAQRDARPGALNGAPAVAAGVVVRAKAAAPATTTAAAAGAAAAGGSQQQTRGAGAPAAPGGAQDVQGRRLTQ